MPLAPRSCNMDRKGSPSPSPRGVGPVATSLFHTRFSPGLPSTIFTQQHPPAQSEAPQRSIMNPVASPLQDLPTEQPGQLSILGADNIFSDSGTNDQELKHRNFSLENYTIDLAALGQSSSGGRDQFGFTAPSDFIFDVPLQTREQVPSEDDGPTDFTLNLGAWMRGKRSVPEARSMMFENEEPQYLAHKVSVGDQWVEESAFAPINVSTPSRLEEGDRGRHTSTTPLSPGIYTAVHEQEMSYCGAGNASEEVQQLRVEIKVWRENSRRLEKRISEEVMRQLESMHATNIAEQRLKEESSAHGATKSRVDDLQRDARIAQLRSDEKILSVEEALADTQQELSNAKDLAADYDGKEAEIELLRAQISQSQEDLLLQQDQRKIHEQDLATKSQAIGELQKTARESTSTNTVLRTELEHAQQQLSETRRIVESVEQENDRFSHEAHRNDEEISSLQNELAEAKLLHAQDKESALLEAQTTILELRTQIDSLHTALKAKATPSSLPEAELAATDAVPNDVSSINETNNALGDALDRLSSHYEEQLEAQKHTHAAETKKLKRTLLKAAEGMKKREDKLLRKNTTDLAALRTELRAKHQIPDDPTPSLVDREENTTFPGQRHQNQHQQHLTSSNPSNSNSNSNSTNSSSNSTTTTSALRTALATLATKFHLSQARLCRTQADLTAARTALDEQVEMHADVNRELEARLVETMLRREAEWRERVRLLLREREKMGKVLLWTWGEQEGGRRTRTRRTSSRREGMGMGIGMKGEREAEWEMDAEMDWDEVRDGDGDGDGNGNGNGNGNGDTEGLDEVMGYRYRYAQRKEVD